MAFTLATAVSELRKAVPSFPLDQWDQDEFTHLTFNNFARYICTEAEVLEFVESGEEAGRLTSVPICMEFLERAIEQGDTDVRNMIADCVDTLSTCKWSSQIREWAGPLVSALWVTS